MVTNNRFTDGIIGRRNRRHCLSRKNHCKVNTFFIHLQIFMYFPLYVLEHIPRLFAKRTRSNPWVTADYTLHFSISYASGVDAGRGDHALSLRNDY